MSVSSTGAASVSSVVLSLFCVSLLPHDASIITADKSKSKNRMHGLLCFCSIKGIPFADYIVRILYHRGRKKSI